MTNSSERSKQNKGDMMKGARKTESKQKEALQVTRRQQ